MANAATPHTIILALDRIRTDGGTQSRAELDQSALTAYAEEMGQGNPLPPVEVYFDGTAYWLADGFHRHAAARQARRTNIEALVHQGTQRDAILHSVGANSTHGVRRSNADKRRAVEKLLRDPEWVQWSDREIARRTHVDAKTVGTLRRELAATAEIPQSAQRMGADGRVINTANIGSTPPQPLPAPEIAPLPDVVETPALLATAALMPAPAIAPLAPLQKEAAPAVRVTPQAPATAPALPTPQASTAPKAEPPKPALPPIDVPQPTPAAPPATLVIVRIPPPADPHQVEGERPFTLSVGIENQMPTIMKAGTLAKLGNVLEEALSQHLDRAP